MHRTELQFVDRLAASELIKEGWGGGGTKRDPCTSDVDLSFKSSGHGN